MLTAEEISEIEAEAPHYPTREALAIDALKRLGLSVEGFGCPEEYLSSLVHAANGTAAL